MPLQPEKEYILRTIIGGAGSPEALPIEVLQVFYDQGEALWNNVSGGKNCGNSDEVVEQIKCFLAAHFWAVTNERGGIREIEIGKSREEYATGGFSVEGLSLTRFGQQAIAFDKSGKLKQLDMVRGEAVFEVY